MRSRNRLMNGASEESRGGGGGHPQAKHVPRIEPQPPKFRNHLGDQTFRFRPPSPTAAGPRWKTRPSSRMHFAGPLLQDKNPSPAADFHRSRSSPPSTTCCFAVSWSPLGHPPPVSSDDLRAIRNTSVQKVRMAKNGEISTNVRFQALWSCLARAVG